MFKKFHLSIILKLQTTLYVDLDHYDLRLNKRFSIRGLAHCSIRGQEIRWIVVGVIGGNRVDGVSGYLW